MPNTNAPFTSIKNNTWPFGVYNIACNVFSAVLDDMEWDTDVQQAIVSIGPEGLAVNGLLENTSDLLTFPQPLNQSFLASPTQCTIEQCISEVIRWWPFQNVILASTLPFFIFIYILEYVHTICLATTTVIRLLHEVVNCMYLFREISGHLQRFSLSIGPSNLRMCSCGFLFANEIHKSPFIRYITCTV